MSVRWQSRNEWKLRSESKCKIRRNEHAKKYNDGNKYPTPQHLFLLNTLSMQQFT